MNNVMRVRIKCHDKNQMIDCRCSLSERSTVILDTLSESLSVRIMNLSHVLFYFYVRSLISPSRVLMSRIEISYL